MSDRAIERARQLADFTLEDIANIRKELKYLKGMERMSQKLGRGDPDVEEAISAMENAVEAIESSGRRLREKLGGTTPAKG